ncbi:MAG: hypothetical protein EOL87_04825 [Spartobacteria bacterium]|nr:hypothetical protein [Spartobacteria bacterium]
MKISDLIQAGYEAVLVPDAEADIVAAYTSDLLSDVMGNAPSDSILMTIQAHKNTVAVATLAGINTIMICNNRPITDDMIESAKEEDVAIFRTPDNQFITSCKIQRLLDQPS